MKYTRALIESTVTQLYNHKHIKIHELWIRLNRKLDHQIALLLTILIIAFAVQSCRHLGADHRWNGNASEAIHMNGDTETGIVEDSDRMQRQEPMDKGQQASSFINMIYVEGGSQNIELPDNASLDDTHLMNRSVASFYIGKYEVTQAQFQAIMNYNPSEVIDINLPVESVSWLEAIEFCNQLSHKEGLDICYTIQGDSVYCNWAADGYRLPTEAEWEFAARGGLKSNEYYYSGSNDPDSVAWYLDNSDGKSHPVGTKKANELGIHDMSGNVWEWCWEWYDTNKRSRLIKGGSWYCLILDNYNPLMLSYRGEFFKPETWVACIPTGFRVCRSSR